MAEQSNLNPHRRDKFSSLEDLAVSMLRSYGDLSAGRLGGRVAPLFIDMANELIEEIRQHPYWKPEDKLDYYVSIQDAREIPDIIMRHGLMYLYATQQSSAKAGPAMRMFLRTMNQVLWNRLNGNTKIQLRVVDGGSNENNERGTTSQINGLVTPPDANQTES